MPERKPTFEGDLQLLRYRMIRGERQREKARKKPNFGPLLPDILHPPQDPIPAILLDRHLPPVNQVTLFAMQARDVYLWIRENGSPGTTHPEYEKWLQDDVRTVADCERLRWCTLDGVDGIAEWEGEEVDEDKNPLEFDTKGGVAVRTAQKNIGMLHAVKLSFYSPRKRMYITSQIYSNGLYGFSAIATEIPKKPQEAVLTTGIQGENLYRASALEHRLMTGLFDYYQSNIDWITREDSYNDSASFLLQS